ncbi:transposase [Sulfitobacter maritimus]|uniref:transposase n=1 Tax=Sulfitobacter maritimus TaxID=2741719 RepID=UPI002483D58D|nr:transposase [Sulfitobacter maritimus]
MGRIDVWLDRKAVWVAHERSFVFGLAPPLGLGQYKDKPAETLWSDAQSDAAVAGLAPMTQQSGKWPGKDRIIGGRSTLRRVIYMPALVADRFNEDLKAVYLHLLTAGKHLKAILQRMIVRPFGFLGGTYEMTYDKSAAKLTKY